MINIKWLIHQPHSARLSSNISFFVRVGRNHHSTWHCDPHHASRGTHYPCNEIWYGHTHVLWAASMSLTHPCAYTHILLRSNSWCHWHHRGLCTLKSVGFKSPTGSSVWLKISCHSLRISLSFSRALSLSLSTPPPPFFLSLRENMISQL